MTLFDSLAQLTPGSALTGTMEVLIKDPSDTAGGFTNGREKRMLISDFATGLNALSPSSGGDVLSTGKAGGQTLRGGTAPFDRLLLDATSAATPAPWVAGHQYNVGDFVSTKAGDGDTHQVNGVPTNVITAVWQCLVAHTSAGVTGTFGQNGYNAGNEPGTLGGDAQLPALWAIGPGVGLVGAVNETFRIRTDGHIVVGGQPQADGRHALVSIYRGTDSGHSSTSLGTGVQILGGSDDRDPTSGNGLGGLQVSWRLVNGGRAEENSAMALVAWSEDPNYPGLTGGGTGVGGAANVQPLGGPRIFHGVDQVNAAANPATNRADRVVTWTHQPNIFSMNPQCLVGYFQPTVATSAGGSNNAAAPPYGPEYGQTPLFDTTDPLAVRYASLGLVTQQAPFNSIEVGVDDRARNGIIDGTNALNANVGNAIRLTTTGTHDIMSAITILTASGGAGGYPATFRHGLVMSTNNKAAGVPWRNSTHYYIGQCVTNGVNNGQNGFVCRADHVSAAAPTAFPGAGANWAVQTGTMGPSQWAIWLGQTNGFTPEGACAFGVNAGTGMPPGSVQTAGMIQMGTITSPGNAPAGFVRLFYDGTNLRAIKAAGASIVVA